MAAVGQWVLEGSSTRVRQMAARSITDPEQLRELIRATRHGNDKTVHRILTDKRDELLAAERRAQQQQADIEAAAAAIARHAERPCDASYAATLGQLEARWRTVESHATPDLQHEVAQHLERAREAFERHRQALEAEAEQQRAAALAAEEARRQRELEAQSAAEAAAEQARIREAEREAEREVARAKRAADEAEVRHLLGLLRQAQAALDHGGTARAARLREAIAEKLPQAPALPEWYARQLQQIDDKLEELKDWKTFRVVPKQAELVQRMQSLVGADISPEELARQIRKLRDEWRTLHRGAGEEPTPEWQQFDEAAERAYEPCREHFARQAEQRKENQQRREALLERLATFAAEQAGEQPNWHLIRQVIFEARQEWQQYAPVDQSVVKSLQARFRAQLDELQARLDAEYARNVQAKRDMIARVAELATLEDTRQAIEESKSLQRAWKTVGLVPRHQDNALWEEFRRNCDAVFERSSQEWAAHGAALEANQARASAVCDELERMAGLPGESLLPAIKQLDELCNEFESLELPRASARDLRQRFNRATDRCAESIRGHREAAARRGWTDLFDGRRAGSRLRARDRARPVAGRVRGPAGLRSIGGRRPRACAEGDARAARAADGEGRRRRGQRRPCGQRGGTAAAVHPRGTDQRHADAAGGPAVAARIPDATTRRVDGARRTRHGDGSRRSCARVASRGARRGGGPRRAVRAVRALSSRRRALSAGQRPQSSASVRFSVPSAGVMNSIRVAVRTRAVCQVFRGTTTYSPGAAISTNCWPGSRCSTIVAAPDSRITISSPCGCRSQVGQSSVNS